MNISRSEGTLRSSVLVDMTMNLFTTRQIYVFQSLFASLLKLHSRVLYEVKK